MGVPNVQEEEFLQEALGWYSKLKSWSANNYAYDWDNKAPGLHVLFAQIFPSDMMQYSINAQTCAPPPDHSHHYQPPCLQPFRIHVGIRQASLAVLQQWVALLWT